MARSVCSPRPNDEVPIVAMDDYGDVVDDIRQDQVTMTTVVATRPKSPERIFYENHCIYLPAVRPPCLFARFQRMAF